MQPWPSSPGASAGSGRVLADSSRWADLRLRLASALVLAPVALGCAVAGGGWWLGLLLVTFAGVCWEWWQLSHRRLAWCVPGYIYALLSALALWQLRSGRTGSLAGLMFVLLVVWGSDIGAYVAGRVFRGPKLAPAISPGKTWSGALGGLVAASLLGTGVAWFAAAPLGGAALVGAGLGVVSQAGDLGESAMKRAFGVKDSGRLIPGHGGLLDRLDGLMAAALVAGVWAWAVGSAMVP